MYGGIRLCQFTLRFFHRPSNMDEYALSNWARSLMFTDPVKSEPASSFSRYSKWPRSTKAGCGTGKPGAVGWSSHGWKKRLSTDDCGGGASWRPDVEFQRCLLPWELEVIRGGMRITVVPFIDRPMGLLRGLLRGFYRPCWLFLTYTKPWNYTMRKRRSIDRCGPRKGTYSLGNMQDFLLCDFSPPFMVIRLVAKIGTCRDWLWEWVAKKGGWSFVALLREWLWRDQAPILKICHL